MWHLITECKLQILPTLTTWLDKWWNVSLWCPFLISNHLPCLALHSNQNAWMTERALVGRKYESWCCRAKNPFSFLADATFPSILPLPLSYSVQPTHVACDLLRKKHTHRTLFAIIHIWQNHKLQSWITYLNMLEYFFYFQVIHMHRKTWS